MSKVAAESTARALQYGPTEGMACTVECIVQVMAEEGTSVDPDEVLVTTGGQQVIDLMCKAFIDPGDTIVAEAPTYPGAVPTFDAYQANVVQIEMDADGMPIDELEATLDRLSAEGRSPKFIYTIPNFQNPGGVTMSLARRRRLVEVAREREILVLEDNPYGLLRYEGEPLPTLHSLDAAAAKRGGASDFVVYLGTFSKILSPGVRLGWAVAPRPVTGKAEPVQAGRRPVLLAGHAAVRGGLLRKSAPAAGCAARAEAALSAARERRRAAVAGASGVAEGPVSHTPRRDARRARRALRDGRQLDRAAGRAVHLGDAARLHRHDRPARTSAGERGRRLRPWPRRLPGRTWSVLDAPQLRGRARGGHPRGNPAHRQGRARAGGPVRHAHGSEPAMSRSRPPNGPRRGWPRSWSCRDASAT